MEEFVIEENETLVVVFVQIFVGEQLHQFWFWLAEQCESLSTIGDEMVEGMTGQLELILMATRKGWMAKLGVATNPSTAVFGEKDLERQKKRRIQDKHKKRRRRNQIVKAGIG